MAHVQRERTGGRSDTDFISNADGSILCDHKGVRRATNLIIGSNDLPYVESDIIFAHPYSQFLAVISLPFLQNPVTVERYLSTKPLRSEVSSRKGEAQVVNSQTIIEYIFFLSHFISPPPNVMPGPGGKKLSYMGGDMVTKTLNETFGYDGWCLEVKNTTREEPIKDEQGRYHVSYIATARITHTKSGAYRGTTFQIIVSLVAMFNK